MERKLEKQVSLEDLGWGWTVLEERGKWIQTKRAEAGKLRDGLQGHEFGLRGLWGGAGEQGCREAVG